MANTGRDETDVFITKWHGTAASELSTSLSFLSDLCRQLGVDVPHATDDQGYMYRFLIHVATQSRWPT